MSDMKLFRIGKAEVQEIQGSSLNLEKSLQTLLERNLEAFLGVRFLASEFTTDATHGGRMDTLGLDENSCPVIIEYKRTSNENVINQGLFYLDWLMHHRKDFEWLVMEKLGKQEATAIEWGAPRLICIAGDFTKYDEHAVKQINRNIELIRYKKYGEDLLLLDLVNSTSAGAVSSIAENGANDAVRKGKTVTEYLEAAGQEQKDRFETLKAFLLGLGDDVQIKELKHYIAFRRIKNFACVEVHNRNKALTVFVKVDPDTIKLEEGFTRDVRKIGHFGTGDLEITIENDDQLNRAKPLFEKSYEAS